MKRSDKIWLIIAVIMIIIGIFGGVTVMSCVNWDYSKLETDKYQSATYEVSDSFEKIYVEGSTEDINFLRSTDGKCRVECLENKKTPHTVSVENGTLNIKINDTRKWYERISITWFPAEKVTVYLPDGMYSELKIKLSTGVVSLPNNLGFENIEVKVSTGNISCLSSADKITMTASTGNITLENVKTNDIAIATSTGHITLSSVSCAGDITLSVSTGKTKLTDVTCNNLSSSGTTGGITLKNVISRKKLSVERDTGDVTLEKCDAVELYIKTDTGDVKGSLLSGKTFTVGTDTGKVSVPSGVAGGTCEIKTDTGDIIINISGN